MAARWRSRMLRSNSSPERRSPCGRERGGQEHAHQDPRRRSRTGRWRHPDRRRGGFASQPGGGPSARPQVHPSGTERRSEPQRRRKHLSRPCLPAPALPGRLAGAQRARPRGAGGTRRQAPTPETIVAKLPVGDRMLVRIAAAFLEDDSARARIFVMDEPTAALTKRNRSGCSGSSARSARGLAESSLSPIASTRF